MIMKKIIILLIVLLSIAGCNKQEIKEEIDYVYEGLGIITPTGAPSLAFLNHIDDDMGFETNSNITNILAYMNSNSDKRVIVVDTISGIKAINKGAPYKLAANITFGNFYIASTGNDDNGIMDKGDSVVLFGQGATPDIIFHYLYGNDFDETIEYVGAVQDAGKVLASGKNFETQNDIDYVFIAEPVLTSVLNNTNAPTYQKASIYQDIQKIYEEKTGNKMIQASIFIKDDGYIVDPDDFLTYLEVNINEIINNKEYVDYFIKDKDDENISTVFGIGKNMIYKVLENNSVGLGFKRAYENKQAIDSFISIFGYGETSEEIYIK